MVRIGVTGHRVLAELDKLRDGVVEALRHIEKHYPNNSFTLLSSLAEGADTLVANLMLEDFEARLIVPLPFAKDEYLKDFLLPKKQQEFLELLDRADEVITPEDFTSRGNGYEVAGLYVLNNCDVLLTIWDGKVPQGQGGTGQIVAEARRRKLPIAWVHAGNRVVGTNIATSLGVEQGRVEFENF
jgi:hypothetical protein